jgi:ribonuclease P protein subunit RPR2
MRKKKIIRKNKEEAHGIAGERIKILFDLADKEALSGDLVLATEYVKQARRIAMKHNIRLRDYAGKYCRGCESYLLPAKTSKVRINSAEKRVEIECLSCGRRIFHPYAAENKAKRRARRKSVISA